MLNLGELSFVSFLKPNLSYKPIVFWFLNHDLEEQELTWQMEQMVEKGIQGFFLHPRSGLLTPYFSRDWFDKIGYIIEEAERLGLSPWLYDDDPYPSGLAGGKVIADHPEYKGRRLIVIKRESQGNEDIQIDLPWGRLVKIIAVNKGGDRIDLTDRAGYIRDEWQSRRQYSTYFPTMEDDYYPHFRADTHNPHYRLYWHTPKGEWTILAFADVEVGYYWIFPSYTDLLNSEAVDYFITTTYEEYFKRYGDKFGSLIPGIFADEPKATGPLPWTGEFPAEFERRRGYPIDEVLPALVIDIEGASKYRADYWRTVTELFREHYADKLYEWCDHHDLKFTGHISPEEGPIFQVSLVGDLMNILKSMHIPGTDIITYRVGDKDNPAFNIGPKLVSSVAHQQGRRQVLAEAFALSRWQFTIAGMVWITNWLYVLGVNTLVSHGMFYSIDGYRKKEAGPSLFYQAIYWPYYDYFSTYAGRLGYMLTEGEHICELGLLYPITSLWSNLPVEMEKAKLIRDQFIFLVDTLLRKHFDYDLVDELELDNAEIRDGKLWIGAKGYRALVLPSLFSLSHKAMLKLREWKDDGGVIIASDDMELLVLNPIDGEELPQKEDIISLDYKARALADPEERKVWAEEIERVLSSNYGVDISIAGKSADEVFVQHRHREDKDIYFLANNSSQEAELDISLAGEGRPEEWNPISGKAIPLPFTLNEGRINTELNLPPRQGTFIAVDNKSDIKNLEADFYLEEINSRSIKGYTDKDKAELTINGNSYQQTFSPPLSPLNLGSTWRFSRDRGNVFILDRWKVREVKDDPDFKGEERYIPTYGWKVMPPQPLKELGIASYPTTIWYRASFQLKGKISQAKLVMETSSIKGDWTIFINGKKLEGFHRCREYDYHNLACDITELLSWGESLYEPGINVIAIEVKANSETEGLLEPLRIMGEFKIEFEEYESLGVKLVPVEKEEIISIGSWVEQGYPFYSGVGIYEQEFDLPEEYLTKRLFVELSVTNITQVLINEEDAGTLVWEPYRLEITDKVKVGRNKITLKVINSLVNLLYGSPDPSGLLGVVRIIPYERVEIALD